MGRHEWYRLGWDGFVSGVRRRKRRERKREKEKQKVRKAEDGKVGSRTATRAIPERLAFVP